MECKNLYLCDPDKNIKCRKNSCYVFNEPCHCTHNKDYAFCIEGDPVIVMTKEDQEICLENGLNFMTHLDISIKVAIKRYNLHNKEGL